MLAIKIILIIILVLFVLSVIVYLTNADSKLVEKVYNHYLEYHDNKKVEETL